MKKQFLFLAIFFLAISSAFSQNAGQVVRGQITDEISKSPMMGVVVTIVSVNPIMGTTSDMNGNFSIANVPVGRQTIEFKMTGYEPRRIENVIVSAGKELVLDIAMTEKVMKSDTVAIVYNRKEDKTVTNNEMTTVSSRSFNIEETSKYAGSLGDPSRMAANFAGVASGNDSRNDIVVRGNSPTGMLWQLEGLNIPNPNHFGALNTTGGPVGILNNNNLAKSDFLTSAFPAQYGNANAGVFDLNMRNGNSEKFEFLGQIGFNGFEGGIEGPFSKNSKASFLVNYRYSTLGVFQKMGINFGTGSSTPLYQDVNYKVFVPIGSKTKITVFGIAGKSSVDFLGNETDTTKTDLYGSENTNTRVSYHTQVHGISLEQRFGTKTWMKISLGYAGTYERFRGDSISVSTREEFPSGDAKFTTDRLLTSGIITHKFNSRSSLSIGFYHDLISLSLFNKRILNGVTDLVLVDYKDEVSITQGYAQWKYRFTDRLSLVTGVHAQYFDLNKTSTVEPRAGIRFLLGRGVSLNAGYGMHSQMQSMYNYFVQTHTANGIEYTNKNLDFTKSQHAVVGADWNITDHLRVKTEFYYQSLYNVPVEFSSSSYSALNSGSSFAPDNSDSLVNEGSGRNYGAELTIERFFHNGYYFLITASLFDSKYKGSDGIERNTAFNSKYVVNALAGKEFNLGKGWVLVSNLRLSSTGGRYLTPIDYNASALAGTAVFIDSKAFSERQAQYFRADVKIGVRQDMKKATMEFFVDLQNVTNHKNVFQQSYNPRTNSLVTQYQQGFFPVPTFRMTF